MSTLKVNELDTKSGTVLTVAAGKTLDVTLANDAIGAAQIATDAVTADAIAANAVTSSEIADDAVTIAKLAATGTASATTFLRGDNAWAAAGMTSGEIAALFTGYKIRPVFTRGSATTMLLNGAFQYHHAGTTTQIVKGANVTFTRSDTSGTAQFNYLYIDDSAVVTAGNNTITASQLISSPTAPTLNTAKGGFYNGNDRCIYAFKQDASNNIYRESRVSQVGNIGTVRTDYTNQFVNVSGAGYGTGWHSYTMSADYLPRPCGPQGLAIAQYCELGGGHSTIHVGPDSQNWDMFNVNSPWMVNCPVNSSGQINVRSDYAHSSYTHIFYTRGWVMSPLL